MQKNVYSKTIFPAITILTNLNQFLDKILITKHFEIGLIIADQWSNEYLTKVVSHKYAPLHNWFIIGTTNFHEQLSKLNPNDIEFIISIFCNYSNLLTNVNIFYQKFPKHVHLRHLALFMETPGYQTITELSAKINVFKYNFIVGFWNETLHFIQMNAYENNIKLYKSLASFYTGDVLIIYLPIKVKICTIVR